ncbi:MAG: ComEC/Rec2 family competence protein [Bacteroidota bacterium]
MSLFRFASVKLSLFLILGILIGKYFHLPVSYPFGGIFLGLVLLGFLQRWAFPKKSLYFGTVALVTTFCIGVLAISMTSPKNQPNHFLNLDFTGNAAFQLKIREVLKANTFSRNYIAHIKQIDSLPVYGKVLLRVSRDSVEKPLQVDDELILFSKLKPIAPPLNPHQFNYKRYMEGLGVTDQLNAPPRSYILVKNPSTTLYGGAAQLRNSIIQKLRAFPFKSENLAVIQALLLGQRKDLSETVYTHYKNAGAVHILAVSGLHVGVILLLLQFLLAPLERLPGGKTLKLLAVVLLLWGFALIAVLGASVIRAVAMFSFLAYAMYLNRPSNHFNILALSLFFILLALDPKLLFQVGFQMSYAAVAAILWIYPKLQRFWYPKNRILRQFWQLLSVSLAAQLGVLPIALFYFHQFPGLFFISNLLVVPFMGVILGIGLLVMALALLNLLPKSLALIYDALIGTMNHIVAWVAEQETFIFRDISFDGLQLVLGYGTIAGLVLSLEKISFKRISFLLFSIVAFQSWAIYQVYQAQQKKRLIVVHQTRNSALWSQNGRELKVYSTDSSRIKSLARNYAIAERTQKTEYRSLSSGYIINGQRFWVIDSLGVFPKTGPEPTYVLLTRSPKINLDRFLGSVRPKRVIADGSNYPSYVKRWRASCKQKNIPFHYTGSKGAYWSEMD